MTAYEVTWSAFGTVVVEADSEDEAVEEARDFLDLELQGIDWEGLDIGDFIDKAADWQTPVN